MLGQKSMLAVGDQAVVVLPISSLVPADSPRLLGEDADHVRALAEVDTQLPPIVVHRPTMRIVDGMHRVKAAAHRGEAVIRALFFDGSDKDAFVLSVKQNIAHGLPLSLADRKAAAARIIADHPERSDRFIATVVGLAPGTVGTIRRSTDQGGQLNVRVGRDGRARPVSGAQRRQRVRELIAAVPTMSIRQLALEADVSVGTAHAVRKGMAEASGNPAPAGDAAPEPDRRQARSIRRGPARNVSGEPVNWPLLRERLRADPALRYSEAGRKLLQWLDSNAISAEEWRAVARSVPAHWSDALAMLAYGFATRWRAFAEAVPHPPDPAAETAPAS
jgi:ParB-like chromosome segregation protein Spo0J